MRYVFKEIVSQSGDKLSLEWTETFLIYKDKDIFA